MFGFICKCHHEFGGVAGIMDYINLDELLPAEVIDAILCDLPVDISFIDADDKVAYYSDSSHPIFPRSPGVIGRDVKNCHPPKSLHMVTEILEPFKRGERNKAEYWLELGGKFIRIQYLALSNKLGTYLGWLEVGQDANHFARCSGSVVCLRGNDGDERHCCKTRKITK